MTVTITVEDDRERFDVAREGLAGFDLAAMVGLHDPELATIGWRHELGEGVPKREWITPAVDAAEPALTREMTASVLEVSEGTLTALEATDGAGDQAAEAIKTYVEGGEVKGKALSDAAKKTDARKLINTGDMIDAVKSVIVRASEAER